MFIEAVPPSDASGAVQAMYRRVQQRIGYVPNWAKAFSLRPEVMDGWSALLEPIRSAMTVRRFELVTFAAARAVGSSYCALAHGSVLAAKVLGPEGAAAVALGEADGPIAPAERAVMAFAAKVAARSETVTSEDIDELRSHGLDDREIFDVAAAAAARCFFARLLDALGAEADPSFRSLRPELRDALVVGRPISSAPEERVSDGG